MQELSHMSLNSLLPCPAEVRSPTFGMRRSVVVRAWLVLHPAAAPWIRRPIVRIGRSRRSLLCCRLGAAAERPYDEHRGEPCTEVQNCVPRSGPAEIKGGTGAATHRVSIVGPGR